MCGSGQVWARPWTKFICVDQAIGFLSDQHEGDQHWSEVYYDLIISGKRMERLHGVYKYSYGKHATFVNPCFVVQ